ncbi:MAG: glycosyltransferase family 25 protein [Prevotella sp.]|nr:glycosyltransferase family 25 protein [Prevotella sp.]MBR1557012.1 glycosyltransferase family 25 protein [Prevotella sp.]
MKALVIHAAKLKERGEHMDRMLRDMGIDYEFIREGDAGQITDQMLDTYFRDGKEQMHRDTPRTSCTIKHFYACEYMIKHNMEAALILEDDIVLHKNFNEVFAKSLKEYREKYADMNVLISYEDSTLDLVPRSQRRKNQLLYKGTKGRTAGAFLMNLNAAKAIMESVSKSKCDVPIDWYHNQLQKAGVILYLWCHPSIATQGSFTGEFFSSLSSKSNTLLALRWWFKKHYKQMLYWFR